MNSKKILVAMALLLSATSVTLAQSARHYYNPAPDGYWNYSAPYGYSSPYGYGRGAGRYSGYYDVAPMRQNYGEERPDEAQPSPNDGVELQR